MLVSYPVVPSSSFSEQPIMRGNSDIQQLELMYRLLGSPEGATRDLFATYPEWDKMQIAETYPSKLQQQFASRMGGEALTMLEKMLQLNPNERMNADEALQSPYLWTPGPPVEPHLLPKFSTENGHEFERKQRKATQQAEERDKEKEREEKRKLEAMGGKPKLPSSGSLSSIATGGPVLGSKRFKVEAPSKGKVLGAGFTTDARGFVKPSKDVKTLKSGGGVSVGEEVGLDQGKGTAASATSISDKPEC